MLKLLVIVKIMKLFCNKVKANAFAINKVGIELINIAYL